MMKSAIEWLMGKSESLSINNDIGSASISIGAENESSVGDKDSSKENSLLNGHFSGDTQNRNSSLPVPVENSMRSPGEEIRSPWGRTLTPKTSKYSSHFSPKSPRHSSIAGSLRMSPPMSWEDISFTSDVISPGFASRIAKEGRGGRKPYDGSRKYPIGQEKYIRAGILPNVRLKGHSKPVVIARRAPTSPLLPLSSSSSPFSSSSLASGFLASASTRMPDISSVVSVLDSTPSTTICETIKDPTNVQAVVAALEQAQNLRSGIKRSRYTEIEDSNKKQKCALNSSLDNINEFATPVATQSFSTNSTSVGGGGEKRALDLSPPSSSGGTPEKSQLSPENKRRCVPDPRIASFSSSKNFNNFILNNNSSGRETPFSMYESHQDSDSESNKSMESHQSKQSEQSYRVQNDLPCGRLSSQENFDHSGSQTPQSVRGGSYGLGASNGSSSSSRTTTPSKPSHIFSLEAYKTDKAKNNQRLNKMLGMLFNVSDEENEGINPVNQTSSNILSTIISNNTEVNAEKLDNTVLSPPINLLTTLSAAPSSTGLLKEAFTRVQAEVPSTSSDNEIKESENKENGTADVSTTYTFTLKSPKQNTVSIPTTENARDYNSNERTLSNAPVADLSILPSNSEATASSSSSTSITSVSVSVVSSTPCDVNTFSSFPPLFSKPPTSLTVQKDPVEIISCTANNMLPPSFKFPLISSSTPSKGSNTTLTSTVNTEVFPSASRLSSVGQPVATAKLSFSSSNQPGFNGLSTNPSLASTFSLAKPIQIENSLGSTDTITTSSCNMISSANFSNLKNESSSIEKVSNIFSLGTDTVSSAAKTSLSKENVAKSIVSFSQPFSATGNITPASIAPGLFSFAASNTSPTFNANSKESTINAPSQLVTSPFVFGASLPSSSSISQNLAPSISNVSTSNMFNFGSKPLTTSSGTTVPPVITSVSSSITQPVSTNSLFSFNLSQAEVTKSITVTTTSNSIFGSTVTFAKPSVSKSSECVQPQLASTSVVFSFGGAPVSSPSIFSFANNSKSETNSTPFSFGTTTTHSIAKPSFGGSIGGGFSFGGAKTTSSTVPQFGASSTTTTTISSSSSTSSTFSFGSFTSKPHTGFDLSTPKSEVSTAPNTNIFTFGNNNNAHSSPFGNSATSPFGGIQTTNSGGPFSTSSVAVPKTSLGFSFGSEAPSTNLLNAQSPPSIFGVSDMGNKTTVKPLFGSNENATASNFGSTNSVSPFGVSQTPSPFNPKPPPPAYGFGASKPETPSSVTSLVNSPPNQSPFQVNQNTNQNAPFNFGQSNSAVLSGSQIFQFGSGSQGTFGAGAGTPFSFGAGNMGGPSGTNIFTVGATSETPLAGRRIKAKAHRRRC